MSSYDNDWKGHIPTDVPLITPTAFMTLASDETAVRGPKRRHLIRCVVFFAIEFAYIAFAAVLLRYPIALPHYIAHFQTSSIKSGLTTLSILWHTAAGIFASDILADSFSREWSVGAKLPTDRVSTITSGVLNRTSHLFRAQSTKTFKFTLFTSLVVFALLRVGPSTIIVSNAFQEQRIAIGGLILGTSELSQAVLKVEQVSGLNTGYETQPNWIIPRPAYRAAQTGSLEYVSDLIRFHHTCQWFPPEFNTTGKQVRVGTGILHLMPLPISQTKVGFNQFYFLSHADLYQANVTAGTSVSFLSPSNPNNSSLSALLIFGGNSTFLLKHNTTVARAIGRRGPQPIVQADTSPNDGYALPPASMAAFVKAASTAFDGSPGGVIFTPSSGKIPTDNTINLDGLPTVYESSLFSFSTSRFKTPDSADLVFQAPLATALLCDANPGSVRLSSNNLTVRSYDLGTGRVGNIDRGDIPAYFSSALDGINNEVIMVPSEEAGKSTFYPLIVDFSPLAALLLLPPTNISAWQNASLHPLPLSNISSQMDAYVLSVSKVQKVEGIDDIGGTFLTNGSDIKQVSATLISQDQVLSSNPLYLYITSILALITLLASVLLAILIQRQRRPPFDLEHILALVERFPDLLEKEGHLYY